MDDKMIDWIGDDGSLFTLVWCGFTWYFVVKDGCSFEDLLPQWTQRVWKLWRTLQLGVSEWGASKKSPSDCFSKDPWGGFILHSISNPARLCAGWEIKVKDENEDELKA